MGTKRRYLDVGDNLSGKTLYFNFSNWKHNYSTSSGSQYNHIFVDSTHRIYSVYTTSTFYSYEALYLQDGNTTTRIGTLTGGQGNTNQSSLTLSNNFGAISTIASYNEVYWGITGDFPSYIYVNGTAVYDVRFNGTALSEIYFNGTKVF